MNYFKGVPFERFKQAVDDNTSAPRYKRVTFTGGEVTLDKSLFDFVAYARESGGFDHIRLQTAGRLLADMDFARRLVDAGIDEFFVSLHGPDAQTQDYISQRKGSFDEAMQGLNNLAKLDVCIMTNTVLTTMNVDVLPQLVDTVGHLPLARMEFWYYLPMEDYADNLGLLPTMKQLIPQLKETIRRAKAKDFGVVVKYVPQCLLGEHGDTIDNAQPDVVIVEDFYEVYPEFACLYEAKCEHSESCLGLHNPYIEKFGWEEDWITPIPRTTPWREPEYGKAIPTDNPTGDDQEAATGHPAWRALVDGVAEKTETQLETMLLDRRNCVYRYVCSDGSSVDIVLTARTSERRALARSHSFNIHYRNVSGDSKDKLQAIIRAAVESVTRRDNGALMLDERKGLVGPDAFRRPKQLG